MVIHSDQQPLKQLLYIPYCPLTLSLPHPSLHWHGTQAVIRGLQAALVAVFNWGLEKFIPAKTLVPGEELVLEPPNVRYRPHMTMES